MVRGGNARETVAALAGIGGTLVRVVVTLRGEPVGEVLDYLAGCVSDAVAEAEENQ